jgi:hypothetical protein
VARIFTPKIFHLNRQNDRCKLLILKDLQISNNRI